MFAIIKDGIVENLIKCDPEFAQSIGAIEAIDQSTIVDIGYSYNAKDGFQEVPAIITVPEKASLLQVRVALRSLGHLTSVNNALSTINDANAKDAWEYSNTLHRNHPMVQFYANEAGLTVEELDEVFILAASL